VDVYNVNGVVMRVIGCVRFVIFVTLGSVINGCSLLPAEKFTLQADMPAEFRLKADAYYVPATGETCTVPKGYTPRKRFSGKVQKDAHTTTFKIPLTDTPLPGGCPLVLKSLKLDVEGWWGPKATNLGGDYGAISFVDKQAEFSLKLYNGQCQWLFRTMGPYRYIVKILQCRAIDEKGEVLNRLAGGVLQRDQLAGKVVNMDFKVANEEEPYYDGFWQKTPVGWKACTGRWGTQNEEYCTVPPQFIDFKMPDGKPCSVYPTCME